MITIIYVKSMFGFINHSIMWYYNIITFFTPNPVIYPFPCSLSSPSPPFLLIVIGYMHTYIPLCVCVCSQTQSTQSVYCLYVRFQDWLLNTRQLIGVRVAEANHVFCLQLSSVVYSSFSTTEASCLFPIHFDLVYWCHPNSSHI